MLHQWEEPGYFIDPIDTLGVVLGANTSIDPCPFVLHVHYDSILGQYVISDTLLFHPTPYFAWIEDGDVWIGRIRYGYWPEGNPEVINLSDSLYQQYGYNLNPCNQISGGVYGGILGITTLKRTPSQDTFSG